MASDSRVALCRLLLQRSDRHPIAVIDGDDIARLNPDVVAEFVRRGFLVERERLVDAGDVLLQNLGDRFATICLDDEQPVAIVDEAALRQFDIGFMRICEQIRSANKLDGRKTEAINSTAVWLGAVGKGSRRREFYMVRALRAQNATDIALAIRGRAAAGSSVIILTPTKRDLSNDIVKRLGADGISIMAVSEALNKRGGEPFSLSLLSGQHAQTVGTGKSRRPCASFS